MSLGLEQPTPPAGRRNLRLVVVLLGIFLVPPLLMGLFIFGIPIVGGADEARARQLYQETVTRIKARERVAAAENGYHLLAATLRAGASRPGAKAARKPVESPYVALEAYQAPSRRQCLARMQRDARAPRRLKAFAHVVPRIAAAVTAPSFTYPSRWDRGGTVPAADLQPLVEVADSLRLLGYQHEQAGRLRQALQCHVLALQLGGRLAGQGDLDGQKVAITLQGRAVEAILALLRTYEPDRATAAEAAQTLEGFQARNGDFVRSLDEEYAAHARMFDLLQVGRIHLEQVRELPSRNLSGLGRLAMRSGFMLGREKSLYTSYYLKYRPCCERLEDPPGNGPSMDALKMRSAYYSVLAAHVLPDFPQLESQFKEVQSACAAAEVLLAVQAYRETHSAYPRALRELVPHILKGLPHPALAPDGAFVYRAEEGGVSLVCPNPRGDRFYTRAEVPYFRYQY